MADENQLPPPGDEKPATMGQVKSLIRRRLRKHEPHEELGLNIYPMMDMMTILLVFLIMQFATTQADIVQSNDLRIPYSTSKVTPSESVTIQISRTSVTVDGQRVLGLREGQVDASQKRGGGTGFLITPLMAKMEEERDLARVIAQHNPNRPFRGEVRIIADKATPFRTIAEVIYTVGQAEFNQMRFIVLQQGSEG